MTSDALKNVMLAIQAAKQRLHAGHQLQISLNMGTFSDKLIAALVGPNLMTQASRVGQEFVTSLPRYEDIGLDQVCDKDDTIIQNYTQTTAVFTAHVNLFIDLGADIVSKRMSFATDAKDPAYSELQALRSAQCRGELPLHLASEPVQKLLVSLRERVQSKVVR